MTKNILLAGVSAAALALAASAAFADANSNSSNATAGDAITNAADNSSVISNSQDNNSSTNNSNQNNEDNTQKNADLSVNQDNHGTIGDHNKSVDIDVHSTTINHNDSTNYVNSAELNDNGSVTASVLGATIAASDVDFKPASGVIYQGNSVTSSFGSSSGISAVNQNTGINSNNQQAITVSVASVNVGPNN